MFFVFSKVLSFLAQPLAIVTMLLVAGWFVRRQPLKKILLRTGVIMLAFVSNFFIANEAMRAWETPVTPLKDITQTYDFGVVLTGVTKTNMKPKDRVYFSKGADRATHTLLLYKMGLIKKVIVSGGSGRLDGLGVREADDLADFLRLAGIPEADIIIENESKNTYESATAVARMLSDLGDGQKSVLLITSAYHIPRSIACFQKAGVNALPFAVEPTSDERRFNLDAILVPKPEAIQIWQTIMREWVGFAAYWVMGYI